MQSYNNVIDYTNGQVDQEDFLQVKLELKKTEKQITAIDLLGSDCTQIMCYGGTRSGKTIILLYAIIIRALKCPGSRHLVARLRFSHAKTSIWHESLPFLLDQFPPGFYERNKSDFYIKFWNGSEIWVGGFDDKKRVEKLLGHEYSTIYFNEVSQIDYDTVILGLSRLAQNAGLENKAYFDCNPPSPMHWTHKLFLEGKDPKTKEPVLDPSLYAHLLMNPMDNLENLPKNYIERFLDILPEKSRARLKYGLFVKPEGMIYDQFEITMIITQAELPAMEYYFAGMDPALNSTGILFGSSGATIYMIDDCGAFNMVAEDFNKKMKDEKGWRQYGAYFVYCDPSIGERLQKIEGGVKANNAVDDGIDYLHTKMKNGEFFVCDNCEGFLSEIWDYKRDSKGRIIKENDHYMDGARYGAYSHKVPQSLGKNRSKKRPITGGMRKERF